MDIIDSIAILLSFLNQEWVASAKVGFNEPTMCPHIFNSYVDEFSTLSQEEAGDEICFLVDM